jgi:hypothetical protein
MQDSNSQMMRGPGNRRPGPHRGQHEKVTRIAHSPATFASTPPATRDRGRCRPRQNVSRSSGRFAHFPLRRETRRSGSDGTRMRTAPDAHLREDSRRRMFWSAGQLSSSDRQTPPHPDGCGKSGRTLTSEVRPGVRRPRCAAIFGRGINSESNSVPARPGSREWAEAERREGR